MSADVSWGHSVLEPTRGHVRDPDTYLVGGVSVGFAICGAWLVADLPDQHGTFPRCATCLDLLDERSP
ncbi:hypothetical protein [Actinophytocola gossypii]|uniref:DUF3039 domain-containing protein n=1 Tax=Actinophytocola gossypii TaxID=2812003 RepID=A0ABT2J530_9PSEU|nr:hypothetical protein [Actinophytocola gossypii]MCT2582369.1 hypothetical protein [Actinophytocola gossypii]